MGANMVRDAMKEEPVVKEDPAALELKEFSEEIKFSGVEFSYDEEAVLYEFNLAVSKGMKIGLVGESGAGKSTLVSLLLRFYDPTNGSITIDGTNLKNIKKRKWWHRHGSNNELV